MAHFTNTSLLLLTHLFMQRRFAKENPHLLDRDEDWEVSEPASKKRKLAGRPAGGQDWWSSVDSWFAAQISARGKQLTGDEWKV
jgi:hypothetical protein